MENYNKARNLIYVCQYISSNYNKIVKQLEALEIHIDCYIGGIKAYKDMDSFKNHYSHRDRVFIPDLNELQDLYLEISSRLSSNYAKNLFSGVNYLYFKEEVKKFNERGEAIISLFKWKRQIQGILSNLDRMKDEKTEEGKISILKGVLIYY